MIEINHVQLLCIILTSVSAGIGLGIITTWKQLDFLFRITKQTQNDPFDNQS
jgi:hypothetical protein